ncbi:hypothetical protein ACSBR1_026658 [Camellia fascicularis]
MLKRRTLTHGQDSYSWKGVECDEITGHDVGLDLGEKFYSPEYSSSVVPIPKFFGLMARLRYLNLSYAAFSGIVPHHLGNLSSLRVLDRNFNFEVTIDDFTWVYRLSSLQYLDLSYINLSQMQSLHKFNSSIPLYLENLKSLEHLNLGYNAFHNVGGMLSLMSNQCSLRSFDMSGNRLDKKMFISYGNLSSCTVYNLETLCSSGNGFIGHLPNWVGQLKHLKYLDLSNNLFNGLIPTSLVQLKHLKYLDLSSNLFNGLILAWLGRMSPLHNFILGGNQFFGVIPPSLENLSELRVLNLSGNLFNGSIPAWLGRMSRLHNLILGGNQFIGVIPSLLGKLSALRVLDLSYNKGLFGNLKKSQKSAFNSF